MVVYNMVARIIGTGSFLPEKVVTNDDLSKIVDTCDEWIRPRTGIASRRIAVTETTASMAAYASILAIQDAGIDPLEVDLILGATFSPDRLMPSLACEVQRETGAVNATCFDLNGACTGFVFAFNTAQAYISSGMAKTILITGAETSSKFIDWTDRSTCILFGDGAGAVIVRADTVGFIDTVTGTEGAKGESLTCESRSLSNLAVDSDLPNGYIQMNGQEVFRFAVKRVPECIKAVLSRNNTEISQITKFILHQANQRILASVAKHLKADLSLFPMNLNQYGNTSAASIPILLDELNKSNQLTKGDKLIFSGFGAGLTWGAILLTW